MLRRLHVLVGLCPPDRDLATRILFLFHRSRRLLVWKRQLGGEMVSSAALGFLLARAERLREAVVAIAAWNLNHGKLQNTSLQKVQKWLKRVCSVWNSEMLALGKRV